MGNSCREYIDESITEIDNITKLSIPDKAKQFYLQEIKQHTSHIGNNLYSLLDTSLVITNSINVLSDCIQELVKDNIINNTIDINTYILTNELSDPIEKLKCTMDTIFKSYSILKDTFNSINKTTEKL